MAGLSANKRSGGKPQQAARCGSNTKQQSTLCTAGLAADGFLTHRFLPLYQQAGILPDKNQVEKDFFTSLSTLAECYPVEPLMVADKPYPYNILLAHWDAKRQLARIKKDMELYIITDDEQRVILSTKEHFNTGLTLFYIPVLPLHRLLENDSHRKCGELLLSVFSYLYQMAGVPYYRDEDSHLFYYYEMLEQWAEDERESMDEPDYKRYRAAMDEANQSGDDLQRELFEGNHLQCFKLRIDGFAAENSFQSECLKVAKAAYELWQTYPHSNLYKHLADGSETGDDEDDEEYGCLKIVEYVSFVAETEGGLWDSLAEMVNSDFNERRYIQEPTITTLYEQAEQAELKQPENLDYERSLFELIRDLCTLLSDTYE